MTQTTQPHMMSDLCSSHQSVTRQTAQQFYNCGGADLGEMCSLIFVRKMSRPIEFVTFPLKNGDPQIGLLIFCGKTHFERHGNRQEFRRKLQQQRQTLEIVEDFAWKSSKIFPILIAFPFLHFFHFTSQFIFLFFHFSIFHFFHFLIF